MKIEERFGMPELGIHPLEPSGETLRLLDEAVKYQETGPATSTHIERWAARLALDVCEAWD